MFIQSTADAQRLNFSKLKLYTSIEAIDFRSPARIGLLFLLSPAIFVPQCIRVLLRDHQAQLGVSTIPRHNP